MSSNDQNQLTISSRKRREKLKKRKIFTKISSRKLQAAKFVQSSSKLRKSSKIITKGCIVRHASTRTRSLAERILRATLSSRSLRIPAIRKPSPFLSKLLIAGNLQVLFRDDACNSNRLFDSTKESEKKNFVHLSFVFRDAQTKQELEFRVERLIEKKKFRRDNFLLELMNFSIKKEILNFLKNEESWGICYNIFVSSILLNNISNQYLIKKRFVLSLFSGSKN